MGLADPRIVYGIHSISPYRRSDRLAYGTLKVIGSASIALTNEQELLYAGSNKFPWAAEAKTTSSELTAKVKALPGFLFELFLGATVTDVGVDSAGAVTALTNRKGTSVVAATGLASVGITAANKANLKFGKYVVKVLTSTTIGVYLLSDIDITRGTDVVYTDDTLLLTLTIGAISTGTTVTVAAIGLEFVGGASATAMVVGDTATFEVIPPSEKSTEIIIGKSTDSFPAFGALLVAQKRATDEIFEIDAHYCVGSGLPLAFEENSFAQPEVKVNCLYDSALDRVFTIRHAKMT